MHAYILVDGTLAYATENGCSKNEIRDSLNVHMLRYSV